jgi:hypothetical protein
VLQVHQLLLKGTQPGQTGFPLPLTLSELGGQAVQFRLGIGELGHLGFEGGDLGLELGFSGD